MPWRFAAMLVILVVCQFNNYAFSSFIGTTFPRDSQRALLVLIVLLYPMTLSSGHFIDWKVAPIGFRIFFNFFWYRHAYVILIWILYSSRCSCNVGADFSTHQLLARLNESFYDKYEKAIVYGFEDDDELVVRRRMAITQMLSCFIDVPVDDADDISPTQRARLVLNALDWPTAKETGVERVNGTECWTDAIPIEYFGLSDGIVPFSYTCALVAFLAIACAWVSMFRYKITKI